MFWQDFKSGGNTMVPATAAPPVLIKLRLSKVICFWV
jgi:hypothetical protein